MPADPLAFVPAPEPAQYDPRVKYHQEKFSSANGFGMPESFERSPPAFDVATGCYADSYVGAIRRNPSGGMHGGMRGMRGGGFHGRGRNFGPGPGPAPYGDGGDGGPDAGVPMGAPDYSGQMQQMQQQLLMMQQQLAAQPQLAVVPQPVAVDAGAVDADDAGDAATQGFFTGRGGGGGHGGGGHGGFGHGGGWGGRGWGGRGWGGWGGWGGGGGWGGYWDWPWTLGWGGYPWGYPGVWGTGPWYGNYGFDPRFGYDVLPPWVMY